MSAKRLVTLSTVAESTHLTPQDTGDMAGVDFLADAAHRYMEAYGFSMCAGPSQAARIVAHHGVGIRIATAYLGREGVESAARDSYAAFRMETMRQFAFLVRSVGSAGVGLQVEICADDPYGDAAAMMREVSVNHRLRVWGTGECGNPHPLLSDTVNNMFRAVHDTFAHAANGFDFSPDGEEGAWFAHSQMYSPLARAAMTAETRGINNAFILAYKGKTFPPQRAVLLPPEFTSPETVGWTH